MFDLYISTLSDASTRYVTGGPGTWEHQPSWSPDGKHIVYTVDYFDQTFNSDLFITTSDGQDSTPLLLTPLIEEYPAWSPSGDQIAYISKVMPSDLGGQIHTIAPDGPNPRQLLEIPASGPLAWSPDGHFLAFISPTATGLMIANVQTGEVATVLPGLDASTPTWSPDGQALAFALGGSGISLASLDGSEPVPITHETPPAMDFAPVWCAQP